jgi:hypothetical protein
MLRTFFQSYDEANPPDRIAMLRTVPGGSVVAFFTEQVLWRAQRTFFGITLLELKRALDFARSEMAELRHAMGALEAEIAQTRALLRT